MSQDAPSDESGPNPQTLMFNSFKEFIRILDSTTKYNLLQALFVYRKLNLTQLSKLLEVSKSTVLHHLRKFEELKLVTYTEVKAKFGALPTKIYQFNVELFDIITQKFDSLVNFHNCESMDDFLLVLKGKQLFLSMINQLFEKSVQYLTEYEAKIKDSDEKTQTALFEAMKKNNMWLNIDYVTNSKKMELMEETKKGNISIRTPDHTETDEEKDEIHPYLAFHVVLPIPPILKFNHESGSLLKGKKNTKK
jgi:DNA-binding transcriptional ArsR family regulator